MHTYECTCIKRWNNPIYEEVANAATHGFGVILAAIGLGVMAVLAALKGNAWHITSTAVFGATLIILYTTSTLYHNSQHPKAKTVLRVMDHSAIFLLIAGTYTPFTLVSLRGPWGWTLFGIVWGLAAAGILLEIFSVRKGRRILSMILYFLMGWLVIIAIKPLASGLHTGGIILLSTGGLSYTFGTIFYGWPSLPYNHAVWHLFVLVGSILHYFAILFYVIPI